MDPLLRWFECGHLPPHLQAASAPFGDLARELCAQLRPSAERTVALRKLLESKDAAVRAATIEAEIRSAESLGETPHISPKER